MKTFKFWTKHKQLKEECESNFIRNGGLLQEKLIAFFNGKNLPFHVYTSNEINKMSNFSNHQILQWEAHFNLYQGITDGRKRAVCIKKYHSIIDFVGVEGIVQEIVIATQMSMHKNSLKLLGCCLETEFPVIVYEFTHEKCLAEHIYRLKGSLPWKIRLKIGSEIAHALAYLQTGFERPIIFRNLSSKDVFLDKDCVAKLTGFYFSVLIPQGEDHVMDYIVGTIGYGAPEYIRSGRLTEKTDVFCFGVLLFELLVGQAWDYRDYHYKLLQKLRDYGENIEIGMIVDPTISREIEENGKQQHLSEIFELALNCTCRNEDDRPDMVDIAIKLKKILDSS